MNHDSAAEQQMLEMFGGKMIRDYSTNLIVLRRSS
jgi:hypothetical protein